MLELINPYLIPLCAISIVGLLFYLKWDHKDLEKFQMEMKKKYSTNK